MAHTSETAFNFALAESLRNKHPLWRDSLRAEQTNVFQGQAGLRPDILFLAPGCQPLVVETEYDPANTVENDAIGRLEKVPVGSYDPVEQAIAVRIPIALGKDQGNLAELIARAKFEYCVFTGSPERHERWPSSGWLSGDIDALAQCAEHAMISQRLIKQGLDVLEAAVRNAAAAIGEAYAQGFVDIQYNLGRILCQVPGKQTNRMAATIIANALMFHSTIAGSHDIPSIWQIQNDPAQSVTRGLLDTWKRILQEINYWPIFKVASDLLAQMPAGADERVLNSLIGASEQLALKGINTRHDLTGRLFQQMIADRKFLATYYTLSTSAALLAELGIGMLDRDWSDLDSYPKLRIADLSCGTGTLLSAAYHAVLARYRHAGGDDRKVHRAMIENAMVAADIMPAATHLCAAQLSSAHPTVTYSATRVYTMPYGAAGPGEGHRGLSIGSLDLIEDETSMSLFSTGRRQAQGTGEATEVPDIRLPHGSSDLVIMNPPFTRPGSDVDTDQPIPSFAGFDTSAEEQRLMSAELSRIRRRLEHPASNGNAGLASSFVDLADQKIQRGGVVALVLPIVAIQGQSWAAARKLWQREYDDVVVVTIAATGNTNRAFSADTGIGEALVIARKRATRRADDATLPEALFINLHQRPSSLLEATETARMASQLPIDCKTGHLRAGNQLLGSYIRAPLHGGCAALLESSLALRMIALEDGELCLPGNRNELSVPVCLLGDLGNRGMYDMQIGSRNTPPPNQHAPFAVASIHGVPDYPALWGHDAKKERRMIVEPDTRCDARPGMEEKAREVWQTASRLHFNRDFRLNSQSLAACMTPEPTIGGSAWPNFSCSDLAWEKMLLLWANTTLGLMCFWWKGTRQQQGRARMTISGLPSLLVLDPRQLPPPTAAKVDGIFDAFIGRRFLPANEAYRDPARRDLDLAVLVDLLGLPAEIATPLDRLRLQWCSEPTVHGGKTTRPD